MKRFVAVLYAFPLLGQQEIGEISPDRPGMTDPPGVLQRGILQSELGTTMQWERHGEERLLFLTMGTPNIRLGIGHGTELRFGGDGIDGLRTSRNRIRSSMVGHSDVSMGLKRQVWSESRWRPLFSVIPAVSMPVGNRQFTNYSFVPGVKLSLAKDLPAGFGASGNLCWTSWKDDMGRYGENVQTLSLDHDVGWGFGAFAEGYRRRAQNREGPTQYILDGGFTHAVNRNVMVDVSFGRVVEAGPHGWFFGFGIAFRNVIASMMR
ncbi:MAG: transporter [Acidobacteria bacterium]|nr:transporter [Acidobacteriota bacterium]